jgi:hypothetical protein
MSRLKASTNPAFDVSAEIDRIIKEIESKMVLEGDKPGLTEEEKVNVLITHSQEAVKRIRNLGIRNFMFLSEEVIEELKGNMDFGEYMGEMVFEEEWAKVQKALGLRELVDSARRAQNDKARKDAIDEMKKIAHDLNLDLSNFIREIVESKPVLSEPLNIPLSAVA